MKQKFRVIGPFPTPCFYDLMETLIIIQCLYTVDFDLGVMDAETESLMQFYGNRFP